jgi:hypothetical protein
VKEFRVPSSEFRVPSSEFCVLSAEFNVANGSGWAKIVRNFGKAKLPTRNASALADAGGRLGLVPADGGKRAATRH